MTPVFAHVSDAGIVLGRPGWQAKSSISCNSALQLWQSTRLFCLQGILSYPFFDPVLTDRAFLASPKAMLISFLLAGLVSGSFIFLFAFTGIFGNMVAILRPTS